MNPEARLFTVHGRVQGVWFRDSTRREAERLGITGYAVNLPDDTVEILAWGESEALHELEAWLQQGPPLARVSRVESRSAGSGERPPAGFRTG